MTNWVTQKIRASDTLTSILKKRLSMILASLSKNSEESIPYADALEVVKTAF